MRMNYGRTGCTGITFDGHQLSDAFEVEDVQVPLLPTIAAVSRELAQRPGAYFASRKVGTREIKVKLRLDAGSRCPADILAAWRYMGAIFNVPDPRPLSLGDGLHAYALPAGDTGIDMAATYGSVELSFICFDPFFYGDEHEVELSGAAEFAVIGEECWPVIDAMATASTVTATNVSTGEYVRIPATRGNSLTIDMGTQSVTRNGEYVPVDLLSDFWPISGEASVRLAGATGTLRYRERYL